MGFEPTTFSLGIRSKRVLTTDDYLPQNVTNYRHIWGLSDQAPFFT